MSDIPNEVKDAICRKLHIPHWTSLEKDIDGGFRPARKYAFYNAEKVNAEGAIELKLINWQIRFLLLMLMMFTLQLMFVFKNYWLCASLLVAEAIALFVYVKTAGKEKMIIDQQKIRVSNADYYWADYIGAYIVSWRVGKSTDFRLVLLRANNTWTLMNLKGKVNLNKLGTAIRDMEPAAWKK